MIWCRVISLATISLFCRDNPCTYVLNRWCFKWENMLSLPKSFHCSHKSFYWYMRGKRSVKVKFCFNPVLFQWEQGSSWWWSYDSWIYNYLCNQFLSPLKLWVWIPLMARCMHPIKIIQLYVIMFVSNLWQVGGFPRFPPPTNKLTSTIYMYLKYCWKWR